MILSWRDLARSVKESIKDFIKNWAQPHKFLGNKTNKRDFKNWKNETQDIMKHFKNSCLFTLNENAHQLQLRFKTEKNIIKRYRSLSPKKEYLKYHQIQKEKGFQFDHIVPFSWSTTQEQAIKIDHWKNLIYIDGKSHAIKTCDNNRYVHLDQRMINNQQYLYLAADDQTFILLILKINVLFNMDLYNNIKNHNLNLHELLNRKN